MGMFNNKVGFKLFGFSDPTISKTTVCILGIFLIGIVACQESAVRTKLDIPPKQPEAIIEEKAKKADAFEITDAQCVLCHPKQPQTIKIYGGKHETQVGCSDCHLEHPPKGTKAVPECSMCHCEKAHYQLDQCGSCHTDTHAPLNLTLEGEISDPCLACHMQQGEELANHPSAHTEMACNECHYEHRKVLNCMECHSKHTEDMNFEFCKSCHPVHMPLVVTYSEDTPSEYCSACHGEALGLLEQNTTKHHDLSCAYCHKNKHKTVPSCYACHDKPHPDALMQKFHTCAMCHDTAHNLNRLSGQVGKWSSRKLEFKGLTIQRH